MSEWMIRTLWVAVGLTAEQIFFMSLQLMEDACMTRKRRRETDGVAGVTLLLATVAISTTNTATSTTSVNITCINIATKAEATAITTASTKLLLESNGRVCNHGHKGSLFRMAFNFAVCLFIILTFGDSSEQT